MNPDIPPTAEQRRRMAIGVWSVLIAMMGFQTAGFNSSQLSPAFALGLMTIISTLTALSHLLLRAVKSRVAAGWNGIITFLVPIFVALTWSLLIGRSQTEETRFALIMVALVPMGAVLLISPPPSVGIFPKTRSSFPPFSPPATSPTDIPFDMDPGEEPISQDETVEAIATVPFPDLTLARSQVPARGDSSDNVTQWMTRSRSGEEERVIGGVQVLFGEGQRDATVHLAFCPPFATTPTIICEDSDHKNIQITVAASFAFGARLVIRRKEPSGARTLSETSQPWSCQVGFTATAVVLQRSA